MKKFITTMFGWFMCLAVLGLLNLNVYAAEGKISFSDPQTKAGEEFSVNVKAEVSNSVKIGEVWLKLTYDSDSLEFISADKGKAEGGAIIITQQMENPTADYCTYTVKFKALKPGSATLEVSSYNISDAAGKAVTVSKIGKSAITIGEGALENAQSEVDAVISEAEEELKDSEVLESDYLLESGEYVYTVGEFPEGTEVSQQYALTEIEINGSSVAAYQNTEVTDYYLIYLENQNQEGAVYLYCMQDGSFVRYNESIVGGENAETGEKLTAVTSNYNDLLEKYNQNMKSAKDIMYVGIVIIVVLLIVIINLIFRGNPSKYEDDYEDEDYEDEEIDEEDEEDDEEEEDYNEEYEEEYEEEEIVPEKAKREKKNKKKSKKEEFKEESEEEFELEIFDFDDED